MSFRIIPFLLLVIPIAEISAFVVIGGRIGLAYTLALILVTAVIGSVLLRWQGFAILSRIQKETDAGRVPGRDLVHGAMILVAGVLLLTPGFVTDTLGFLLFVPAVRDFAWSFLKNRITVVASSTVFSERSGFRPDPDRPRSGPVVDLDESDFHRDGPNTSPWSDDRGRLPGKGGSDPDGQNGL